MSIWATIGELVQADIVPQPRVVARDDGRLTVKVADQDEVDRWVRTIGMPPAAERAGVQYGSVDFQSAPGWCGYVALYVYCDLPLSPVLALKGGAAWSA